MALGGVAFPAAKERKPDWARVCIKRTDVKKLMPMDGAGAGATVAGDGSGNCVDVFLKLWRIGALFARLKESILGGVDRVTWPSSST